jgi:hypothetical protein
LSVGCITGMEILELASTELKVEETFEGETRDLKKS